MSTSAVAYEVRAIPKGSTEEFTLRRFPTREKAEDHPVKLALWESVRVVEVAEPPHDHRRRPGFAPPPFAPPRLPLNLEWVATGFVYLIDADGKKLGTLYGSQAQREWVGKLLLDALSRV